MNPALMKSRRKRSGEMSDKDTIMKEQELSLQHKEQT